jgi:hypothetical protein
MAQVSDPNSFKKTPQLKTDLVESYPQEVLEYYWLAEAWFLYQTSYITYTSFGEPSETRVVGNEGDVKTFNTYNSDHNIIESLVQIKEGDNWVNYERLLTEYLDDMMETKSVSESWNGSAWVLDYGTQYEYTLDGNQISVIIITIFDKETGQWINSSRVTHTYSGGDGQVSGSISDMWKDGTWEAVYKTRYEWEGDNLSIMYMSGWVDGAWEESSKMVYEYGENQSTTLTMYSNPGDGSWAPAQRFFDNYDSHGNTVLSTIEFYTTQWDMLSGTKCFLTYNGGDVTERITQSYGFFEPGNEEETFTSDWKNILKEEFKEFASLSTDPLLLFSETVEHYPNPAKETMVLKLSNLKNNTLSINVLNAAGQVSLSEKVYVPIDEFRHTLNLNELSSGLFVIIVKDESGRVVSSSRLIHQ